MTAGSPGLISRETTLCRLKTSPQSKVVSRRPSDCLYGVGRKQKNLSGPSHGRRPHVAVGGDSQPADPTWSPDGKSIAYGGGAISSASATDIRILDLDSKHSRTIPGSEHMFSPRLSPDGRYIVALSDDQTKVFLYSLENARWKQVLLPGEGGTNWPTWSHDSRYLYVFHGLLWRFRVPDGPAEAAPDFSNIDITVPIFSGEWFALTPDDRILVMRDRGIDELYALDLEYR